MSLIDRFQWNQILAQNQQALAQYPIGMPPPQPMGVPSLPGMSAVHMVSMPKVTLTLVLARYCSLSRLQPR